MRETVAHGVDAELKPRCHAWLADAAAASPDPDPEFLAVQNEAAGRWALAARYAEQAGDRAACGIAL